MKKQLSSVRSFVRAMASRVGRGRTWADGFAAGSIKRRLMVVLGVVLVLQTLVAATLLVGALISRAALVELYEERLVGFQYLKAVNDGFALSVVEVAHKVRDGKMNARSEEHTSELQSLMRISYAVLC